MNPNTSVLQLFSFSTAKIFYAGYLNCPEIKAKGHSKVLLEDFLCRRKMNVLLNSSDLIDV